MAANAAGDGPGQTNLAAASWSITIDAGTRTATLYSGPNLAGSVIGQKMLDTGHPWYLRYIQGDGTSAGKPAGDHSLFLYDFCSTPLPTPPSIATEPQSQTASQGQQITLSVVASGWPAPSYQWFLNGAPIVGANGSSYMILSAQPSNAGLHSVLVSNYLGSVTSVVASLTFAYVEIIGSVVIDGTVGQSYRVEPVLSRDGVPSGREQGEAKQLGRVAHPFVGGHKLRLARYTG